MDSISKCHCLFIYFPFLSDYLLPLGRHSVSLSISVVCLSCHPSLLCTKEEKKKKKTPPVRGRHSSALVSTCASTPVPPGDGDLIRSFGELRLRSNVINSPNLVLLAGPDWHRTWSGTEQNGAGQGAGGQSRADRWAVAAATTTESSSGSLRLCPPSG